MNQTVHQHLADSCNRLLGVAIGALVAPINPAAPAGVSLRGNRVYQIIIAARRSDDHTLPMGPWQRESTRADWDKVSYVAVEALWHKAKDLQVAAWLLEAQIHKNGFAAIGASLHVIQQLCQHYWEDLYPTLDDDGLERRANIFHWIDEKIPPALRQVPLVCVTPGPRYGYADWERARRQEQMRLSPEDQDGITDVALAKATGATPTAFYVALDCDLDAALAALDELTATLAPHFDDHAPPLSKLRAALQQIRMLVGSELHVRGVRSSAAAEREDTRAP